MAPFEKEIPTRVLHAANRIYARVFHDVEVFGTNRIPHTGPAMVIANHRSGIDPLIIQSLSPRPIVWMMAREYLSLNVFAGIFKTMRVISVARDGKDSTALRAALRALADGALLGVFPEGRISTGPSMLPLQTGAALIALRGSVPVIPIHHSGVTINTSMVTPFIRPQHVHVTMCTQIHLWELFPARGDLDLATNYLASKLQNPARHPRQTPRMMGLGS